MSIELVRTAKAWIRAEINSRDMKHENLASREAIREGFNYAIRSGQADRFVEALDRSNSHLELHGDDPEPIREDLAFIAEIVAKARLERPLSSESGSSETAARKEQSDASVQAESATPFSFHESQNPDGQSRCTL